MGIFCPSACDYSYIFFLETFQDQQADHFAGGGRVSAGFQNCCISGSNGIYQRLDGKQERIVPWTHNENDTVGGWFAETAGMKLCQRSGNRFFFCISADIFQHMSDLGKHQSGFAHIAFKIAFSQIFFQCRVDLTFVFSDCCFETF